MLVFPPRPEDFKFNEAKSPRLRIVSFSSAVATVVVRGVTKTGLIHDTYETVADRLIQTRLVELTEIPLGIQVETTTDAIQRGVLYFQIHLEFAAVPALTLGAGYITTGTPLTWPGGRHNPPTEGRGLIFTEAIADPGAGSNYSIVTPANTIRRLIEFKFVCTTDATAATRTVFLRHLSTANVLNLAIPAQNTQTASLAITYSAANWGQIPVLASTFDCIALPEIFLALGDKFNTGILSFQAGDALTSGRLTYEEWLAP